MVTASRRYIVPADTRSASQSWAALIVLVYLAFASSAGAQFLRDQQILLNYGWNLISIQVENANANSLGRFPVSAIQDALRYTVVTIVGGAVTNQSSGSALVEIWSYEPPSSAAPGWTSFQPLKNDYPHDLSFLEPGKGYWLRVNRATVLSLSGAIWTGPLTLYPGWNLVGLPGLDSGGTEVMDLSSVFRGSLEVIPQIWTFDNAVGRNRYVGFDTTARPTLQDMTSIEAGRGYWIFSNATDPLTIDGVPRIALPPDIDASPFEPEVPFNDFANALYRGDAVGRARYTGTVVRFSSTNDFTGDFNQNGVLDTPYSQDTLLFNPGENRQTIIISSETAGLVNWGASESLSWLSFEPNGFSAFPSVTNGLVGARKQYLDVYVDREGLPSGRFSGVFSLRAGKIERLIKVLLITPEIDGDFQGFASVSQVNGKPIGLGRVDLNLSLFRDTLFDNNGTNRFLETTNNALPRIRAILNRDRSLLFPRDIALDGAFYSGPLFSLSTSSLIPAGDRNLPPFNVFKTGESGNSAPGAAKDLDENRDGIFNDANPFPFPITREVSLIGSRLSSDRLEGTYVESIRGLLPDEQSIYLEGSFQLNRLSYSPSRQSAYNLRALLSEGLGGTVSGVFSNALTVLQSFVVKRVNVALDMAFPNAGRDLEIRLFSPSTNFILKPFGEPLAANYSISPPQLPSFGAWQLWIRWDGSTGERGVIRSWDLGLDGLATYSISGTVYGDGNPPVALAGANVLLSGTALTQWSRTDQNGKYSFANLTEDDFKLISMKPGFLNANLTAVLVSTNLVGLNLTNRAVIVATNQLLVSPPAGTEPLLVTLIPLVAAGTPLPTLVTWAFGDGTTLSTNALVPVVKTYSNVVGTFFPSVSFGAITLSNAVTVLPLRPTPQSYTHFLVGAGFIGSAGTVSTNGNLMELSSASVEDRTISNLVTRSTLTRSILAATNYGETKRDPATVDVDREPLSTVASPFPRLEDSDFFLQEILRFTIGATTYYPLYEAQNPTRNKPRFPGNGAYDAASGGQSPSANFRMVVTLGGMVFGESPSRVRDFILQAGRIEP